MAIARLISHTTTSDDDCIAKIKDTMVAGGWTLHDDQSASDYYILSSNGESGNEMTTYCRVSHAVATSYVHIHLYLHWNATAHTGTTKICDDTWARAAITDAGGDYLWCYANKDFVWAVVKKGTAYAATGVQLSKLIWGANEPLGTLQSGVSSGSSVVCTLAAGEAANFVAGQTAQIVGAAAGEGRQMVIVSAVDSGEDEITITTLSYNFSAGARIGVMPHKWLVQNSAGFQYPFGLQIDTNGTGDCTSNATGLAMIANSGAMDPDERTQKYLLVPWLISEYNHQSALRYSGDYVKFANIGNVNSYADTMSDGEIDSGTATSGGASTLTDSGKSWATNDHAAKALIISGGTGAGQIRKISSNTSTELTVDVAWVTEPDATSTYRICTRAWRFWGMGSAGSSHAVREV